MGKKRLESAKISHIKSLRQKGYSIDEICSETKVPKTTVFRYITGVPVLDLYKSQWLGKRGGSKKRKHIKEQHAYEEGKKYVDKLSSKEKILILSALYWGEGNKKDFSLTNTDPNLIRIFISIIRENFNITSDKLRVSIRIYEDLSKDECLSFWSKVVGISANQFVNVNVLKGKKSGKLKYGMCRVRVLKGGDLLKKIHGINKAVVHQFAPIA